MINAPGKPGVFYFKIKIKHKMAERTIVDIGKSLQRYGLNIGEHPQFGGVGKGHSPTGYHPRGEAIDVRDWRPDIAPAYSGGTPKDWKTRTGELRWRAKQLGLFNEVLGPGDPGHDTHVHLALSGKKYLTDPQLEWLATGRTKTPEGKLTDIMPSTQQPQSTTEEGVTSATALSLFGGLLNALQPKQKTFQQELTEGLLAQAMRPSRTSPLLTQYMQSGPLDEIIYG